MGRESNTTILVLWWFHYYYCYIFQKGVHPQNAMIFTLLNKILWHFPSGFLTVNTPNMWIEFHFSWISVQFWIMTSLKVRRESLVMYILGTSILLGRLSRIIGGFSRTIVEYSLYNILCDFHFISFSNCKILKSCWRKMSSKIINITQFTVAKQGTEKFSEESTKFQNKKK
jgi:hypothetical protein